MFGLSFLSPAFLAGALAAALPVALHLLGRRPEVAVMFPAVRLLRRTPAEETRRRRVRDRLLLALRVGALVLLAVAFARPYLARVAAAHAPRAVVVAVDRSFSMSAPRVFERARAAARAAIGDAGGGTVGLLAFDDEATVIVKPTTDTAAVLRAIDLLKPGYGGTSYSAALAKAGDALDSAAGRVVLITDLQRSGWDRADASVGPGIEVSVTDVGGTPSNVSVSSIERRGDGTLGASVRDSGAQPRSGRARLIVDGRPRAVVPYAVAAGALQPVVFPGRVPDRGEAVVEIDDTSGYQADNRAYALLDPVEPPTLLALAARGDASRGSFYLQRALEVDGGHLFRLETRDAATFSRAMASADLQRYAGVIVLGTRGLTAAGGDALREYVLRGGGVLVSLNDEVQQEDVSALLAAPLDVRFASATSGRLGLLPAEIRHPLWQSLPAGALGDVRFDRVARAEVRGLTVLARFSDGVPALGEVGLGSGRVLIFASDLSNRWNNLPLQPVFLPFVHEVARYLGGRRVSSREFFVGQAPPGTRRQPGIASVATAGAGTADGSSAAPASRRIVVNVDPRESDVGRITVAEFDRQIVRRGGAPAAAMAGGRDADERQALWRLAIVLAIGALVVESRIAKTART